MTGTIEVRGAHSQPPQHPHIAVRFPYDVTTIAKVKQIARANRGRWYPENKEWRLPIETLQKVKESFPDFTLLSLEDKPVVVGQKNSPPPEAPVVARFKLKPNVQQRDPEDAPLFLKVAAIKRKNPFVQSNAAPIDDPEIEAYVNKIRGAIAFRFPEQKLFEHQVTGVAYLCKARKIILADDMGLGKTRTSLVAATLIGEPEGLEVIVICPASLKQNWIRECASVNGINIKVYSWAKLPEVPPRGFILIADEAHYAQNAASKRGKGFLELSKQASALFLLTGTPLRNGQPVNMYPLLKAIGHEVAVKREDYEKRYCNAHRRMLNLKHRSIVIWDNKGSSNLLELHDKTRSAILRRMKHECLDLPSKTRVKREASVSEKMHKLYDDTFKDCFEKYKARVEQKEISDEAEAVVLLTFIRKAASFAKVETAIEIAEDVVEQGNSVVLFTEFVETAKFIADHFKVKAFTGELNGVERQSIVDRFQSGEDEVFVGTIKAGGVGLTLTAASTVILVDRPLTPGDADQSEDRVYRIGQLWPVTAVWVQAFEIDEKIDKLLEKKQSTINQVLSGDADSMKGSGRLSPGRLLRALFRNKEYED